MSQYHITQFLRYISEIVLLNVDCMERWLQ